MGKILDSKFSNINASMSTNSTYSKSYSDYARTTLQDKIDSDFLYSTDIYTIEEELERGTLEFQNTVVRITHILKNNIGIKLGDDFKEIIFPDINHTFGLGYRYKFDNNIWITTNSDYYHYPTASVIVRRCDNTLKWRDSNNSIIQEPCIIMEGQMKNNVFDYNDRIIIPEGDIQVTTQYNDNSKTIKIDDRFLFGDQAFRVRSINNFHNQYTYENDSPRLLNLTMIKDNMSPYDNLSEDIPSSESFVDSRRVLTDWGRSD